LGYHIQEGMIEIIPGSALGLVPASTKELDQDSSGMNGTADVSDRFGAALAVGDFNGDGYDDLAVGVPQEDYHGAVQIIFGGPSGLTSAGNLLWDETYIHGVSEEGDQFGATLAAGDFDGDGRDDLAIGVPYEDFGPGGSEYDCGQVYVLFGATGGFDRTRTQPWAENNIYSFGTSEYDDRFGFALAVGDFDRDGYDDLAIGHPWEDLIGPDMGAVTILMGSANRLTNTRDLFLEAGRNGVPGAPPQSLRFFGYALAAGDFDGDGHDDLGIGVPGDDMPGILDVGGEIALYGSLFSDGFESGDHGFWTTSVP
jgi:FG-GAP repeat